MPSEYRLTGRLESGELAELYRADKIGGGSVVVKLFHPKTTHVRYAREVAETQNRLLKITNPGIAQLLDIGIIKDRLALVREDRGRFTLGQALQRLNTKEIVISPSLAMAIVLDLLEAVTEAHGVHVLHGALTPGNVLLSQNGHAALCDFGALAALNAVPALKKSFAGRGRSSYRAPEVAKGEGVTMQSDVYSLGAVMYELLTLKVPPSSAVSTRREQLPPPSRLDRRLNSRFDPLVLRALDPAPARRYKTTSEFASAMRSLLAEAGGLPDRDQMARFTAQLFPNEVQLALGPVPFEGPFTLTSVDGAELEDFEGSLLVRDRPSFSGTLDEMQAIVPDEHPTVASMPAVEPPTELEKTALRERERSTNWHAPAAAMPQSPRVGSKESGNAEVLKRVRHIEDFASVGQNSDTHPGKAPTSTTDELPTVLRPRVDAMNAPTPHDPMRHVATPADSQPISGDDVIVDPNGKRRRMFTEERNVARMIAAPKKWLPIVAGSALLAAAFLAVALLRSGSSPDDASLPYIPPRSHLQPIRHSPTRNETARDAPARPPPTKNCYAPPKKALSMGFISVAADRQVWVKIDGDYVCGSHTKIPVVTGARSVAIVDTRTGEEYVKPVKVDPNMNTAVIPDFKGH